MTTHSRSLLPLILFVFSLILPVRVPAAGTSLTFTPVADAYINESAPTTNYGTVTTLLVDSSPIERCYLRFTVSGVGTTPVASAILKIYPSASLSEGFSVNALSNTTWAENTINYNNAPAPGSAIQTSGAVTSGTWVSIDLTPYIQGDGTYNLALTALSSTKINLVSREAGANSPQLVVTLSSGGAATPTQTPSKTLTPTPSRTPTPTPTPTAASGSGKIPAFSHVIFILFENKEYGSIIGNSALPNFNGLAKQYTLLTQSYAVRHPSLPNYIALTSGSTQGITTDCTSCYLNVTNIADKIEASGRTWKAYLESMPSPCYLGNSGLYVQKHNPFVYYNNIRTNATRCKQKVVPLTQLDTDLQSGLPNFAFIMPNNCNSAHDCSTATADKWLGSMVSKIRASSSFDQKSLIVVTFDEGTTSASCCGLPASAGGHIATILISPLVKNGYEDATPYSHYSLLKMLEKAWGMPYLGLSADTDKNIISAPWK
jgi:hypothetical protein